jgi:formate dehydrogenase major subunit
MVEAIHEGKLKAMYLIGEEMSIVDSSAKYVGAAFEKLDFVVVGATTIVARDIVPSRLDMTKELGATRGTRCAPLMPL